METFNNCPCCGAPLADLPLTWCPGPRVLFRGNRATVLTPNEAIVFEILWKVRPHILSHEALSERSMAALKTGTMENFDQALSHLRHKLSPLGLQMAYATRGFYLLVPVEMPERA